MLLFFLALAVGVILFIVFMERSQRRLLVQYPKRQVGNRMFGGETSFLPLKINVSGVIPPIFASVAAADARHGAGLPSIRRKLPTWLQWLPDAIGQLQPRPAGLHGRLRRC